MVVGALATPQLQTLRNLVPPLVATRYKGQAGKVGVLGGCSDYTGAPFYAAISALKLRHISPLPKGLEEIFSRFKKIYVVEMNDGGVHGYGQLAGVLRARFADPRIRGINKTDALRWKVWEIIDRVNECRNADAAVTYA